MRGVKVFAGRSHPLLAEAISERLGTSPAKCDLGNFANGEISVQINTSIRNEDVFIVQSGSKKINDSVMELLIMAQACNGGSAKSITAVMPYFPYSRQSKKKAHRGSITAKMLANLMAVAGIDHVITVDLHASQMQGFFRKGVDNLHSEPLIARWIKANVSGWREAVVVSKNVGGSKRVTSLADALKLSFAIVSRDRTRHPHYPQNMMDSMIFFNAIEPQTLRAQQPADRDSVFDDEHDADTESSQSWRDTNAKEDIRLERPSINGTLRPMRPRNVTIASSPLVQTVTQRSSTPENVTIDLERIESAPSARRPSEYEIQNGFHDERARDVVIGRLVHGHIVDDDHPSPALSAMSGPAFPLLSERMSQETIDQAGYDPMTASMMSTLSSMQADHALGGTFDAEASSEEEEESIQNPEVEHTITLVGNVRDRTALIMDDIMDRSGSWIAAAETCVKRGGAKKVYCIGIHALLGEGALEDMEACDCIDHIVVTNTFPISPARLRKSRKLVVIDLSNLLSEAIRRNHHGESVEALFMHD